MKLLFRSAASAFVLLGTLLLDGHARDEQAHPATAEPITVRELTGEEARKALLELARTRFKPVGTHSGYWPEMLARYLEDCKIESEGNHEIRIGVWKCDLREHSFHANLHFPEESFECGGVIERSPEGKWVARMTGWSEATKKP
jgi:hypothetical protein